MPEPTPAPQPGPVPGAATAPDGAIIVSVGDDIQALVSAAPEGAVFWIEAGVHRLQSITPKDGQHFLGEEGAVLNGSRLLNSFSKDGSAWVASGQTQEGMRNALGEAAEGYDRAGYPETIYIDDQPLKHVGTKAQVVEGTFFFDYAADKIYIGNDPAGHKVEASVQPWAFEGGASDVVVQNLTIEKYATPIQRGAIGGDMLPEGWIIQDNDIQLNYGVGIAVGSNTQVLDNRITDNGNMGLAGVGDSILVEGNEIAENGNWAGIDVLWEGGGTKFALTEDLVVRDNFVHDNHGFGLWTDIDNFNTLYEGNRVEYNSHGGIVHEISYDAVIRDNVLTGNGADFNTWLWGAGIIIQNSRNVDIYGNTVDMTEGGNGISLIQQDRGDPAQFGGTGEYGEYITIGNTVHDNVIISRTADHGGVGAVADFNEAGLLAGGNSFDNNEYQVTNATDDRFAYGDWYDWNEYRAVSGWDQNSTLTIL
ncbi:right-handed parallel beta-helix repeat-containing protein [Falsiroseomonas tokyonensis]|uniref:Right-handed parallel beta-helix repeat-containing protein n=1 Tax=Falsiroseomonas tokyonensis TaxID=430521 RepID=A0ABV7C1Y2_9PROT|nr:right-handed parallel beta-helix repeat-containing protein [Falsiroseomonas tokyonensis]MBU8541474.1 right-handed parallel beta-helix repeat-containing protein [Falsiroseomonas tokyonensis]